MTRPLALLLVPMTWVLQACSTEGKRDVHPHDAHDTAVPSTLEPSDRTTVQPLRRLSKSQLQYTLADFIEARSGLTGEDAAWIRSWVADEVLAAIPEDTPTGAEGQVRGGFRRLDQVVYAEHVEAMLHAAEELTTYSDVATSWGAARHLDGTCDIYAVFETSDTACLETWIRDLGLALHRRPLTDDQVADYLRIFQSAADETPGEEWEGIELGFHHVFVAMVASPWFGYHVELGDEDGALTDHELASRLSFHFWQTTPDAALFAAAAAGELRTDAGYRAQVDRLVADPRTERAVAEFAEDFFRTEELPRMDSRSGTVPFDTFAADAPITPTLHEQMGDELVHLTVYHTLTAPGPLDDLYLSDRHVSPGTDLSTLYGQEPWDGTGSPPALVDARRTGLLTRAALLATGSANTRPIMKGVFIREGLLCEPIPPPPDNANASPPELSEDQSTREVVETLTEQEGSDCVVCHGALINPLGFATEDFDALGRPRSEQDLYDAWGEVTGAASIDTSGETTIAGHAVSIGDVTDLTSELLSLGAAHHCYARELLRFSLGRAEDDHDAYTLAHLGSALEGGLHLDDVLVQIALSAQFRTRGGPELAVEETRR